MSPVETDPRRKLPTGGPWLPRRSSGGPDLLADLKRPLHVACLDMAARQMGNLPQGRTVTVYK